MGDINYDFRASARAPWFFKGRRESVREEHLNQLAPEFPSLFEDIDIDALKMDVEAVNIITAACETVSIILDAKNKSDKPVYAALGENHAMPAHRLHHMLVVKDLSDRGFDLSVGEELPESRPRRDFLSMVKNQSGNSYDSKMANDYFYEHDLAIQMPLTYSYQTSPYSHVMLSKLLLEHSSDDNVTVKLTDAARFLDTTFIDSGDAQVMEHASGKVAVMPTGIDGMNIRNKVMVKNIPNADVMLQISGSNHIDDRNINHGHRLNADTLIAHAKDAGYMPVGRILRSNPSLKMNAEKCFSKTFENQEYLSAAKAISEVEFNHGYVPSVIELSVHGEEIEYVNTKLDILGMGDVCDRSFEELNNRMSQIVYEHVDDVCMLMWHNDRAKMDNDPDTLGM